VRSPVSGRLLVVATAVLAGAVAAPAAAEETTLRLSPAHAPAGGSVAVDLRSDCKLNYLNLTYSRYDGGTKTATTLTDGRFDEGLQKYRYVGRLAVPGDAAYGSAVAYAQPYCGPPEEYPASRDVPFTVDRSVLRLAVSPARVRAGTRETLRVSGGDCAGSVSSVPLRVRWPDGSSMTVTGAVRSLRVSASFALPPSVRPGTGTVALARPDACPGSRPLGPAVFTVRAAAVASESPAPTLSPSPTPFATLTGLATPSVAPAVSPSAAPPPARRTRPRPLFMVGLAVAALAGSAGGAFMMRRRGRPA
jgi:hypothetical protein